MRVRVSSVFVVFGSLAFVVGAPLKVDDKLTFLNKGGYEATSHTEEIIPPVSDNGVRLSDGFISKPDTQLYGRFYTLRKKALMEQGKPLTILKEGKFP